MGRLGLATVATLAAAFAACSSGQPAVSVDAALDHVTVTSTPDAPVSADAGLDASLLETNVRLALLSPLGIGIDVCVRPSTSASAPFQGPLLYLANQLPALPGDAGHDGAVGDARADGGPHVRDAGDAASHLDARDRDVRTDSPREDATSADAGHEAGRDGGRMDATTGSDAARDGTKEALADGSFDADSVAPDGPTHVDSGPRNEVTVGQVSNYLKVQGGGAFEVAIVVGGSSSCQSSLALRRVSLEPGYFTTLAVMGSLPPPVATTSGEAGFRDASNHGEDAKGMDASRGADATRPTDATLDGSKLKDASHAADAKPGDALADTPASADASVRALTIVPLVDEPLTQSSPLAQARFFNATTFTDDAGLAAALRVVAVEYATTLPLAIEVPAGQRASQNHANPSVDGLGYWTGPPLSATAADSSPFSIKLRVGGPILGDAGVEGGVAAPSWTFAPPPMPGSFDLIADTNHSGFILGGGTTEVQLLWCNDNMQAGAFGTDCALLKPQ